MPQIEHTIRVNEPYNTTCRFSIGFDPNIREVRITPLDAVSSGRNNPYVGTLPRRTLSEDQAREMIRVHYYTTSACSSISHMVINYEEPSRSDCQSICQFKIVFDSRHRRMVIRPIGIPNSGITGTFTRADVPFDVLNRQRACDIIASHYYPVLHSVESTRIIYAEPRNEPIRFDRDTPISLTPSYRTCEFRVTHYPSDNGILLEPVDTPSSGITDAITVPYYSSTLNNNQIILLIREHYYGAEVTCNSDGDSEYILEYREPGCSDGPTTCRFKIHFYPRIHQVLIHPLNRPNSGINDVYAAEYPHATLSRAQARELIKGHYYPRTRLRRDMSCPNRRRRWLTLMPYSSFQKTARCLMDRDLKLMRSVSLRVLWYLTENIRPRRKAAEMWRGYEQALIRYGMAVAKELRHRGFKDTSFDKWKVLYVKGGYKKPQWVYWPALRKTHRQYLVLRAMRHSIATACHAYSRHVPSRNCLGLRDVLRIYGCSSLRTSTRETLSDVRNELLSSPAPIEPFQNHYNQFNWDVVAVEEFVYPES